MLAQMETNLAAMQTNVLSKLDEMTGRIEVRIPPSSYPSLSQNLHLIFLPYAHSSVSTLLSPPLVFSPALSVEDLLLFPSLLFASYTLSSLFRPSKSTSVP